MLRFQLKCIAISDGGEHWAKAWQQFLTRLWIDYNQSLQQELLQNEKHIKMWWRDLHLQESFKFQLWDLFSNLPQKISIYCLIGEHKSCLRNKICPNYKFKVIIVYIFAVKNLGISSLTSKWIGLKMRSIMLRNGKGLEILTIHTSKFYSHQY